LNSLQFDRIITFESTQYSPTTYWDQIPDDIIGRLTFINRDVEKTGQFNPWNILKSIGTAYENAFMAIKIHLSLLASSKTG
jgi:hypothetical protein